MKNALEQIEDNQAEREDAAAAAELDQEMADNRRLLASIAALPRPSHQADRDAETGSREAGQ